MVNCDMCGRSKPLIRARIEGAELSVCESCAKYGSVINVPKGVLSSPVKNIPVRRALPPRKESSEILVSDFHSRIKSARESLGLSQEQFAKKLNEKCSLMSKIESGSFHPSIVLAKKLERLLKIVLVEDAEEGSVPLSSDSGGGLTLGDFIKN